jgi:acetoin utilization protein AcuB
MFVRDYMTLNPVTVGPDVTFPEAVNLLRKNKIRRLPVLEDGQLVGIVEEKDLLSNQPSPATSLSVHEMYYLLERLRVRQMMTRPVITVEGDCPLEEAARIMVEHTIGCLPVMDGARLAGIITETDIFKIMVDVLGGEEAGMRITLRLPDKVGELAGVTARIAQAGGNILSITTSRIFKDGRGEVMIKERGANPEKLPDLLQGDQIEILDIRSSSKYQPRLFG